MHDAVFSGLDLTPGSRWPLRLRQATIEAVLARPVPHSTGPRSPGSRPASIVVVSYNNLVLNRLCLESVLANTDWQPLELIVVDNGSEDGTVAYLQELARLNDSVRILLNGRNLGFAAASNQGLAAAGGEVLVLLNNDTIVPPRWLQRLVQRLEDPAVGLVGPVTNRCGNEAQIEVPYVSYQQFVDFAHMRARRHAGEDRQMRMLMMFCAALRRDTYERIGPLDERFETGLFEDEDYAMRLRDAGYALLCAEDVFVHHFGQASIGKLAADGRYGELFRRNRRKFEEKWQCEWRPHGRRPNADYQALVARIRRIVETGMPADAIVAIASKGDEDLLTVAGRRAWHFPQGENGLYAGYHPADSDAAIRHLEQLRGDGAAFLLLPAPMFWWLQFYPGFAGYLASHYPCVRNDDTCLIYQLADLKLTAPGDGARLCKRVHGAGRLVRSLVTLIYLVGNDARETTEFLRVLLRHGKHPHRLLLVTHAGHAAGLVSSLREFTREHGHIALAETGRPENAIAAINIGCQLAPGDVVVLDGPGELADHWLERLGARAYSRGGVATVTLAPCSPVAQTIPSAAPAQSGRVGTGPPAPVPNATCIYVTRAAIRRAGLLDERLIAGVSEAWEDFRARASDAGFVHLAETAGPLSGRGGGQPCILALVHAAGGGTRFATEDLVVALAHDHRCLLLETGVDEWLLYEVLEGRLEMVLRFGFARPWGLDRPIGAARLAALKDICVSYAVDLVNVHHLLCSGPEVLEVFAQLDVPAVFTFHDYYPLCPTAHLVDDRGKNCGGVCTPGPGECPLDRTFFTGRVPVLKHAYVHEHRRRMALGLARCSAYTAPSRVAMAILKRSLPALREQDCHIVEHGRDLARSHLAVEPERGKQAKIVCLGNLNEAKGANLIRELLTLNAAGEPRFEFHFLGGRPRSFRPEGLGGIHHGPYARADCLEWLRKIGPSFSLCASICEETHSYTLTESWAAGLPVFASALGALRERIEQHDGGWLFDPGDAAAFFAGMTRVLDTPGAWRNKVASIHAIPLRTVADEARAMTRIFRQSLAGKGGARVRN